MSLTYEMLGEKISFDEQVLEYGRVKKNFNVYYEQLEQTVVNFYRSNVRYVMAMYAPEDQKLDYTSRLQAEICKELSSILTEILQIVEEKGIKGKTREDYANDNPGLNQLFEISGLAFAAKVDLWNHGTKMATKKMKGDQYEAVHVVKKHAYGNRVSEQGEALLKEMEANYDKYEAAKPEIKRTAAAGKVISRLADDWFDAKWFDHFYYFSQNVLTIIYNIMDDIVERVMKDCVEAGLFSADVVHNVDAKRSNELLQQAEEEKDKKALLCQALTADPSNQNVYAALLKQKCFEDGVLLCAKDFEQAQIFLDALTQEVEEMLQDVERDETVVSARVHAIAVLQGQEDVEVYRSLYGETIQDIVKEYAAVKDAAADEKQLDEWLKKNVHESIAAIVQMSEKELDEKLYAILDNIINAGIYKEFTEKELLKPEQIRLEGSTSVTRKKINEELKDALQTALVSYMKEAKALWEQYLQEKDRVEKELLLKQEEVDALKKKLSKITILSFSRKQDVAKQLREKEHRLAMYKVANDPQRILNKLEDRFSE